MSNTFDGLITDEFKQLFYDGVDTLLDPATSVTVICRLIYVNTDFVETNNPQLPGDQSSQSITGSPIPLFGFQTPAQSSTNKAPKEVTEDVDMIVNWNPRLFANLDNTDVVQNAGQVDTAETLFHIDLLPKIFVAQYAIFDLRNENYNRWKFVKIKEPQPLGLFGNKYGVCIWKRAG